MRDLTVNNNSAAQSVEHKFKPKPTKQEEQDGSLFDSLLDDGNQETDEAKLLATQSQVQEQAQKQQLASQQQNHNRYHKTNNT